MTGINRHTGKRMQRAEHIRQSIADILFTPVGSRIMREPLGSTLPELIDAPQNQALNLRLAAASYMAIIHQEPRILVQNILTSAPGIDGSRTIEIRGIDRASGQAFNASIALTTLQGTSS
jgi:phage baseplate assembly protein W